MNILIANPRGFCAGVDRAIEITEKALSIFGAPIYVKHEIVHNKSVIEELKLKGAVFIAKTPVQSKNQSALSRWRHDFAWSD